MNIPSVDRKIFTWLQGYFHGYRRWFFLAIGLLCIAKGIEAYLPFLLGQYVRQIFQPVEGSLSLNFLVGGFGWIFFLLAIAYLIDVITLFIKTRIGQKALLRLRESIFSHILHCGIPFFDRMPVGQLMTRTIHDVDKISQMFTESVVPLISSVFLFLGIGVAILWIDWVAGLALWVMVPCTAWLLIYFRVRERTAYREVRKFLTQMNSFIQEHFYGAHVIRHFGLLTREKELFSQINRDHREANRAASAYYSFLFAGLEVLHSCSLILLFLILAGWAVLGKEFQAGLFFMYSLYALMFFRPLVDLAERFNILQEAFAASERVFHVLQYPVEEEKKKPALSLEKIETIAFEDVWFGYEIGNWVLKGLSFVLREQEAVGLVGLTGVGKTTIFSLLLQFYPIQRGRILVNGQDLSQFSKKSVRELFSIVLQDPFLFSDTLERNIFLSLPPDRQRLDEVARKLGLSFFVKKFSLGWDEPLQEKGNRLSTGEQQIVSLFRAIVYDRPIFLLDEATAHIDTQTEKALQHALQKVVETKTTLIIAHRLSTVQHVDRILVLSEGRIAEEGSHEELLKKKGIYEKLYRLSFLDNEGFSA